MLSILYCRMRTRFSTLEWGDWERGGRAERNGTKKKEMTATWFGVEMKRDRRPCTGLAMCDRHMIYILCERKQVKSMRLIWSDVVAIKCDYAFMQPFTWWTVGGDGEDATAMLINGRNISKAANSTVWRHVNPTFYFISNERRQSCVTNVANYNLVCVCVCECGGAAWENNRESTCSTLVENGHTEYVLAENAKCCHHYCQPSSSSSPIRVFISMMAFIGGDIR